MSKGLEALRRIKMLEISCDRESYDLRPITKTHKEDLKTIEQELQALEIINKLGIKLVIPDNDYSKEHITIEIYRQHFTKEEWEMLKKELDL